MSWGSRLIFRAFHHIRPPPLNHASRRPGPGLPPAPSRKTFASATSLVLENRQQRARSRFAPTWNSVVQSPVLPRPPDVRSDATIMTRLTDTRDEHSAHEKSPSKTPGLLEQRPRTRLREFLIHCGYPLIVCHDDRSPHAHAGEVLSRGRTPSWAWQSCIRRSR
jgi:hypothetical protein